MARRRLKSTSSRHNVAPHTKRFLISQEVFFLSKTRLSTRRLFFRPLALTFVLFFFAAFVLSPWFLQTPRVA